MRPGHCDVSRGPSYGQLTGTDDGVEGSWLIALEDDGVPLDDVAFFPIETMPDVVLGRMDALPIGSTIGMDHADDPRRRSW